MFKPQNTQISIEDVEGSNNFDKMFELANNDEKL